MRAFTTGSSSRKKGGISGSVNCIEHSHDWITHLLYCSSPCLLCIAIYSGARPRPPAMVLGQERKKNTNHLVLNGTISSSHHQNRSSSTNTKGTTKKGNSTRRGFHRPFFTAKGINKNNRSCSSSSSSRHHVK